MFATPALRHRVWKSKCHMRTKPVLNGGAVHATHVFGSEGPITGPPTIAAGRGTGNWTRTMHPPECIQIYYSLQIAVR